MQVVFLGTGAMVPTKQRNVSSVLLEYAGEFILFDCGEGTQRQMNLAGCNRIKTRIILLTHWHGDHVSGLIGLIQTMGNIPEPRLVTIIGPLGTKKHMQHLLQSALFDKRLPLEIIEVYPEVPTAVLEREAFIVRAVRVEHSVPTIAFRFQEKSKRRINLSAAHALGLKQGPLLGALSRGESVLFDDKHISPEQVTYIQEGRSVTYVMDTGYTQSAIALAENSDMLICESTFCAKTHQDKAEEYGHLSAFQAATIAKSAHARQLVLTHFSQRYPVIDALLDEAKEVFPQTIAAYDFLSLSIDRKE